MTQEEAFQNVERALAALKKALPPTLALARFGASVMHERVPNTVMAELDAGAFENAEAALAAFDAAAGVFAEATNGGAMEPRD